MRSSLVRVAVDQAFGKWNGPVDPETYEFVYVPIPEEKSLHSGLETPYSSMHAPLKAFAKTRVCDAEKLVLPQALANLNMHLDPDFEKLTYGDNGITRGKAITEFSKGDLVVFYSGLRPCRPCQHRLIYAIIGVYRIAEVVRVKDVDSSRWHENAHTRREAPRLTDVIIRADPSNSGRLRRCLPIGEWRDGAYRVRNDLLAEWGALSCKDGFIQRSAVPPSFTNLDNFLRWFDAQNAELMSMNNVPS